ncbi:MAG: dockerin type I domain-containing protein [Planctomycetota bacterium]
MVPQSASINLYEYDVKRDRRFSALDALVVINRLSRETGDETQPTESPMSEAAVDEVWSDSNVDDEDLWDSVVSDLT